MRELVKDVLILECYWYLDFYFDSRWSFLLKLFPIDCNQSLLEIPILILFFECLQSASPSLQWLWCCYDFEWCVCGRDLNRDVNTHIIRDGQFVMCHEFISLQKKTLIFCEDRLCYYKNITCFNDSFKTPSVVLEKFGIIILN